MKKMLRDLGVQLYSLRDYAKEDFPSVLEFVAEVGFKAVEPAGFFGYTPKEVKKMIDDLGLKMYTTHSPWACRGPVSETIDVAGELGISKVACGFGPDDFKDMDAIKRTADLVNSYIPDLKKAGITLFQHNHSWEFERIDGRLKYDIYAEMVPEVKFQIDAFWSSNFGANDPAEMVKHFADRMVSLHIKDGSFEQDAAKWRMVDGYPDRDLKLRPLGTGQMDIPAIIAATPETVNCAIVELDYCVIEMKEALRQSYQYMVSNGLAAGNK